ARRNFQREYPAQHRQASRQGRDAVRRNLSSSRARQGQPGSFTRHMTDQYAAGAEGWEYNIVHTDRLGSPAGPQLALIWKRKYSDGSTDWDQISKLGREGWEMVNAFPVESSGTLQYLAFIFKRR